MQWFNICSTSFCVMGLSPVLILRIFAMECLGGWFGSHDLQYSHGPKICAGLQTFYRCKGRYRVVINCRVLLVCYLVVLNYYKTGLGLQFGVSWSFFAQIRSHLLPSSQRTRRKVCRRSSRSTRSGSLSPAATSRASRRVSRSLAPDTMSRA